MGVDNNVFNNYSASSAFGFMTSNHMKIYGNPVEPGKCKLAFNIGNILGWIPVIGTIVGIARLVFATQVLSPDSEFRKGQIGRAVFELVGLGFLLPLADIPITIGRVINDHFFLENSVENFANLPD